MHTVTLDDIRAIQTPQKGSHKGQNGRLLLIGGSHLFHAASLWALTVASRIVDLVHYASVPENNELVAQAKAEFRNGIVVPRDHIAEYIQEDDVVLIGPGMTRDSETELLTNQLLTSYPSKQWVIDAGALQMLDVSLIPKGAILTPHHGEFELLRSKSQTPNSKNQVDQIGDFAQKYQCIVLVKGEKDIAVNGLTGEYREIVGGNPGMTKGGTGDVLAGLIAALACTSDSWVSTLAGSYINKRAGDELYKTVGPYFNATDLAHQIPNVMHAVFVSS